jgi:hypothetical protein
MGRAHVRASGSVPPEQFGAALTDIGAGPSGIRRNGSPKHLAAVEAAQALGAGDPGLRERADPIRHFSTGGGR